MKFVRTCIAVAAMAPLFAFGAVSPGQWSVGGIQQICLKADGSWYGTQFSGWGGFWAVGKVIHIYGNYSSGDGNDSMQFNKKLLNKGTWNEWHDGQVAVATFEGLVLSFVKTTCDPPPARVQGGKANPAD